MTAAVQFAGVTIRRGEQAAFQMYINNVASTRPALAARFYPQGGTFDDTRLMYTIRLSDAFGSTAVDPVPTAPPKGRTRWRATRSAASLRTAPERILR